LNEPLMAIPLPENPLMMNPSTFDAATGSVLANRRPSAPAPAFCPFRRTTGVRFAS
jgi:hypothetical protein